MRGRRTEDDKVLNASPGMARVESKGLFDLFENNDKRQQGSKLIERQIEIENLKDREARAKNEAYVKQIELKQEKKVNSYLDKISREHYHIEKHQTEFKKVQMRNNLEESLQLREQIDMERASNVLQKEASLNHRMLGSDYKPVVAKALNIEGAPARKVGSNNLDDMYKL